MYVVCHLKTVCQVDYTEFLEGMSSFKHSGDKALRFCFDIYDTNGAGCINLDQLKAVLSCVTTPEDFHEVSSGDGKHDGPDRDGERGCCAVGCGDFVTLGRNRLFVVVGM